MLRLSLICTFLTLGLVLTGCNDEAESSDPPSEAVTQSATAQQAMEKAGEAVTDALVEQAGVETKAVAARGGAIADGMATMWPFAMGERMTLVVPAGFTFDSSLSFVVDLDAPAPGGSADRYPNATGSILVEATATGDVDGTYTTGSVAYTVDLTVQDDVVVTDPHNGSSVTWPSSGSASWTVDIAWAWSDENNWSYQADVTKHVEDRTVIVTTAGGDDFTAVVDVHHEATRSVAAVAGTLETSFSLTGTRHAVWTAPSGATYDVTWDVRSLFEIHLTVNGSRYGPYTLGQVIRLFRVGLNTEAG